MKREDVTGSKNYNADDLLKGDLTLVVEEVTQEEFKQDDGYKQKKLVVAFRGKDKRLVCGKTKAEALFDMLGDDTDDWIGQRVRLTLGKTSFAGKRVNCVDVAAPLAKAAPATKGKVAAPVAEAEEADDDDGDPDEDGEPPF